MYKALLDKVSRGRNLPPVWAAFFMAGENPGEMEAICSSFLPLLILCRPLLWLWALAWACGALSISWRGTAAIIPVPMLMYGREAQSKTRIASPATIPKSGERNRKIHSCMLYLISIWTYQADTAISLLAVNARLPIVRTKQE